MIVKLITLLKTEFRQIKWKFLKDGMAASVVITVEGNRGRIFLPEN